MTRSCALSFLVTLTLTAACDPTRSAGPASPRGQGVTSRTGHVCRCAEAGTTVFVRFEGLLIPVACTVTNDKCEDAARSCAVDTGFKACGLPPSATLSDLRGRDRPATQATLSFCPRRYRGETTADNSEDITGYRVRGDRPALAQLTTAAPVTLVAAARRTVKATASDHRAIAALDLERPRVEQGVSLDYDGDGALDKAFVVHVRGTEVSDHRWSIVIVPSTGAPAEHLIEPRTILGVTDLDRDGAEELIVQEAIPSISASAFRLLGKHLAGAEVAYCDSVPLDADGYDDPDQMSDSPDP